jgi:hypothetical protein
VGNAVCVALSKAIVLAAIAVQKGDGCLSPVHPSLDLFFKIQFRVAMVAMPREPTRPAANARGRHAGAVGKGS